MSTETTAPAPTLNPIYNDLLLRWAKEGHPSLPECEECGRDLTGEHVIETRYNWTCKPCARKPSCTTYADEPREDFHADG